MQSSDSAPSPSIPRKKPKLNEESRHSRMKDINENIQDIDEDISFKEKRRAQAESIRDYRLCDELTERIGSLKDKKRLLRKELSLLEKKETKSVWYKKKKKLNQQHSCAKGSTLSRSTSPSGMSSTVSVSSSPSGMSSSPAPNLADSQEPVIDLESSSGSDNDTDHPLSQGLPSPTQ